MIELPVVKLHNFKEKCKEKYIASFIYCRIKRELNTV